LLYYSDKSLCECYVIFDVKLLISDMSNCNSLQLWMK
jgi:hypothetical protein